MIALSLVSAGIQDETSLALRAELINLFPEVMPKGSRSEYILRQIAGSVKFENIVSAGAIRGIYAMGEVLYVVAGERLYSVADDGTRTNLGTILGSARVSFADGYIPDTSRQLAIGTGDVGYIYDTVDGLQTITDPDFLDRVNPTTPVYLAGRFIWPTDDGFLPSGLNDPLSYDAAEFQTAESSTDGVVGLDAYLGQLWVVGSRTTEVFDEAATGETLYTRVQTIEYGSAGPYASALADNGRFWLDQHKRVFRANGYTPRRISTHQIEQDLKDRDVSQAFMFSWIDRGHEFVALTVPDGKTFVYDCSNDLWHRRKSEDLERWYPNGVAVCYGETFFSGSRDGIVYQQSYSVNYEGDYRLIREFYTAYLHKDGDPLFASSLMLVMDTGNATQSGDLDRTNPVIEMRYSDNGGKVWTNFKAKSLGLIGEYAKKVMWWGLGSIGRKGRSAMRVFHFRISDRVRADFIAAGME